MIQMLKSSIILRLLLYILSAYTFYLYTHDIIVEFFKAKIPSNDYLKYLDIVLFILGGFILGIIHIKLGSNHNKILGYLLIILNIVMYYILLKGIV